MTKLALLKFNTRKYRRAMVRYALDHGLKVEPGFTVETSLPLGTVARAFLLRLQKHMNANGRRKKGPVFPLRYVDGTLNSRTQKILCPPLELTLGQKIYIRAMKEVGVHEYGENRGTRVGYYQSSTGAYGQAWCASFCCKMAQEEGSKIRSAGAWNLTDSHGMPVSLADAKQGDFVSLDIGDGHVGILERVNRSLGSVTLVAGNTSDSVKVAHYPISKIHSICRAQVGKD